MSYECTVCNKKYKSPQSLWNHKNKYHQNEPVPVKKYYCEKCGKSFSYPQSKWRHETQKCTPKNNSLENEIIVLKNEINELKAKPNIINNNITQNNIIISALPGSETIDHLTNNEKRFIMNKGLQCLVYLIETTNFNQSVPKNHSYCVTSLNDKHASMIDTKTNAIIKKEKCELFDMVLSGNLKKLEHLSIDSCFTPEEKQDYIGVVERLKNILFTSKRGIKKYYNEINLLSYNNKEMIYDTWKGLANLKEMVNEQQITNNSDSSDESSSESDTSSDEEVNTAKLINFKKKFVDTQKVSTNPTNKTNTIKIKDKEYFIDGFNVYIKNPDNSRGELYGAYLNGKIKKHFTPKENEIEL
jgi:hypothetical protein